VVRKADRCTRVVAVGSFTSRGRKDTNRLRFTGRVGGRRLAVGSYRLRATPTADGVVGVSATTRFRIR
jgi:hypothetical protein